MFLLTALVIIVLLTAAVIIVRRAENRARALRDRTAFDARLCSVLG